MSNNSKNEARIKQLHLDIVASQLRTNALHNQFAACCVTCDVVNGAKARDDLHTLLDLSLDNLAELLLESSEH